MTVINKLFITFNSNFNRKVFIFFPLHKRKKKDDSWYNKI